MHEHSFTPLDSTSKAFHQVHLLRQHRRSRDQLGQFVIEGIRQFLQASDAGFAFETIIYAPRLLQSSIVRKKIRAIQSSGVTCAVVEPGKFRSISTTERASGVIAIVRQRWIKLDEIAPTDGWLVIENLRSLGNFGTILRTVEATGMPGVILVGDNVDPYSPDAVRASMGGIFHLNLVRTQLRQLGFWLAEKQVELLGLSPSAEQMWCELDFTRPYAIAIGEERAGLSPGLQRLCDRQVKLFMSGRADSLNVSVAAGVMMYELVRRRILK